MSADNYFTVKFNREDLRWYVLHGFMSNLEDGYPAVANERSQSFEGYEEAMAEAFRLDGDGYGSEYGVIQEDGDLQTIVTQAQADEYALAEIERWQNYLKGWDEA